MGAAALSLIIIYPPTQACMIAPQLVFSAVELHHLWERTQLFKGGRLVKVFDSFDVDGNRCARAGARGEPRRFLESFYTWREIEHWPCVNACGLRCCLLVAGFATMRIVVSACRKLDATELRSLLSLLFGDVPVPTSTVERVARAIDKNGDGYIDIDELQTAWEAWFGQSTPPVDARRASGGECSIS